MTNVSCSLDAHFSVLWKPCWYSLFLLRMLCVNHFLCLELCFRIFCFPEKDSQTQRMNLCLLWGGLAEGICMEFGMDMGTLLCKMDNQQGPRIQHMAFCLVLCSSLDGGAQGRLDTCVCTSESLCCSPETIRTFLIDYIPIQNKNNNNFLFYF